MESATTSAGFLLNGRPTPKLDCASQTTLLDYVRDQGLTGAKEGCAEGECGACAVLLVSGGPDGALYRAVNSCLIPAAAMAGQEIYTVESLADSGMQAEVQRAMVEHGGSQCGYCTPGFVVSMFAAHIRQPERFDPEMLGGNLCRCTGYRPIRDAFQALGRPRDSILRRRLNQAAPMLTPFHYQCETGRFSRPCDLHEALKFAATDPAARFVAGNTDLGVATNLRYQRFPHLISLDGIPDVREFHDADDYVEIGASMTLSEIEERWQSAPPVLGKWLRLFASPLIRNRATLGGNLQTASPIGDAAPLLLALDAELRIATMDAERFIPLYSFFRGYRETALERGEIIRSIRIPKPLPDRIAFYKVAKRRMDDISTVAAAFAARGSTIRMAFGGVAPIPLRAFEAEQAGRNAREVLARTLHPISDHRGSAGYRLAMAQNLVDRFFAEGDAA